MVMCTRILGLHPRDEMVGSFLNLIAMSMFVCQVSDLNRVYVKRPLSEFCKSIDCLYFLLGPQAISGETGNSSYAIFGGQTRSIIVFLKVAY